MYMYIYIYMYVCMYVCIRCSQQPLKLLTFINVRNHDLGALVGKQARGLRADALARAGDDGDLAREQAPRVVEVLVDLRKTVLRGHCDFGMMLPRGVVQLRKIELVAVSSKD